MSRRSSSVGSTSSGYRENLLQVVAHFLEDDFFDSEAVRSI